MNVLIVDDLPTNLKLLRAILEAEDIAVFVACDGVEALLILEEQKIDAIISDILMPRMDGYRLCHEVRSNERFKLLPFIIYTASYTSPADEKLSLELGADKFLRKPAPAKLLLNTLQEVVTDARCRVPRTLHASPQKDVMKEYNERLVAKLEEKNQDLKLRTEELNSSRAQLLLQATALETAANAILITNTKGVIQWVNPAFTALTGYTKEEASGQTPRILKSGHHDAGFYRLLWRTILNGDTWSGQFTNRRKDGSVYYDHHTITPVREASGRITHFVGIMNDVTEQKRVVEALRTSEAKFRTVFEAATDGLFILQNGAFVEMNINGLAMVGWARDQLIGSTLEKISPPTQPDGSSSRERAMEKMQNALAGSPQFFEWVLHRQDGRLINAELTLNAFEFRDQIQLLAIVRDVTEQKQAAEQLAESERRFSEMLENVELIAMIVDTKARVSFCNDYLLRLCGRTREEALGGDWFSLFIPEGDTNAKKLFFETIEAGNMPAHNQNPIKTKTGELHMIAWNNTMLRDGAGKIVGVACIGEDITERQKHERLALRSQRLEAIGTLAGGVAHDLNNALAPIMMGVELLKAQYPDESEILDMLHTSARRGAEMVRQLLTFARGAEGERVAIQPSHLLREMHSIMKGTFPKNIQFVVHSNVKIPTMRGDATQLHQILLNLCVNARDAMPQGGTLTLEAQCTDVDAAFTSTIPDAKPGRYVVLRVRDTGTGIQREIIDRIFEPFFTTKGPDKGTGLGLSTVLGIAKGHGGFLHVYSQPGQGSTFAVYLPAESPGSDAELETKPKTDFRGQGETILVVDDEVAVREMARHVLRRLNFKPLTATDGTDALIQLGEHRAELKAIITDMHMPHMDGLGFVRALRRMLPDIPVMVASGRMEDPLAAEFKCLGVTRRLDKPFTENELAEGLKNLLATK